MIKKVIAASAATGGLLLMGAGTTLADSGAHGAAVGSPGVLSGNLIQVPIHIPANVCGNTVNVVGVLNPAFGNRCANVEHGHGHHSEMRHKPQQHRAKPSHRHRRAAPPVVTRAIKHHHQHIQHIQQHQRHQLHAAAPVRPELARTGAEKVSLAIPAGASAAMIVGGVLLYRRGRRVAARD